MRLRMIGPITINEPASPSYYLSYPPNPSKNGTVYSQGTQFDFLQRFELMEDEPTPPPPTRFKPCVHTKLQVGPWLLPGRVVKKHYDASARLIQYDYSRASLLGGTGLGAACNAFLDALRVPPTISGEDRWRMARAWDKIEPQIKPKLDVLVFLAELKDVVDLARSLLQKIKTLWKFGGEIVQLFRGSNGLKICARSNIRALAEVSFTHRKVAANWLELNFALVPLANDLIGIVNSFLDLTKQIEDLKAGANKWQKAYASATDVENRDRSVLLAGSCTYCGSKCLYSMYTSTERGARLEVQYPGGIETRVGMTVMYRYSLPAWVDELSGKANALLSALGARLGPAVVWELIPFSFVVDWFIPIGSWLSRFYLDPFPVKTEVSDVCVTKKQSTSFLVSGRPECRVNSELTFFQGISRNYVRTTDPSVLSSIPAWRRPDWFQLSLGAALADIFRDGRRARH